MHMFLMHVGVKDSNKAKVMAILEALPIFSSSLQVKLIIRSDSSNDVSSVSSLTKGQFSYLKVSNVSPCTT